MKIISTTPSKIRQLRLACGYSQEVLASAWQVSQAAVSKLESGKSAITLERAEQAAAFYKFSVDELIHDDLRTLRPKVVERQ